MSRSVIGPLFLALALAGCAAAPQVSGAAVEAHLQPTHERTGAVEAASSQVFEAQPPAAGLPSSAVTAWNAGMEVFASEDSGQLALWKDPVFQRRFQESFLAETEIEPKLTALETEKMREIIGLLGTDEDKALALLAKQRVPTASAQFDYTFAGLCFQKDQLDEAVQAYQVAVDKHPKFRRAWKNLALVQVRLNEFEPAVKAFTKVLELGGAEATTYGLLGLSYFNLENYISAESSFRMAILLDPNTIDWALALARSQFKLGRYADAASLCGNLIQQQPERAEYWILQANAFLGMNEPMRAAENFAMVDQLGQSTVETLNMQGDVYINNELYDLAAESYVRALQKGPDSSPARAIRAAKVLSSRAAFDECRALLDRIEELRANQLGNEDRKELLRLKARIALAEGAGEEEAQILREIVELDPLDGDALLLLGLYYNRIGEPDQAILYYERAAGMEQFEADAKVRHAQLLVNQRKFAEALPLLRRAQVLQPRDNIQEYLEEIERKAQAR